MTIVVLIGYSCAGKSSALRPLLKEVATRKLLAPEQADTDRLITLKDYFGKGIFGIFLDLSTPGNNQPALNYIRARQSEVLKTLAWYRSPAIIAAGPLIMQHREWNDFKKFANPKCVWLKLSPAKTLDRLLERQNRYAKKSWNGQPVEDHPNFGCWNDDTLMEFETRSGRWKPRRYEDQLEKTTEVMKFFADQYYSKENAVEIKMDLVTEDQPQETKRLQNVLLNGLYQL